VLRGPICTLKGGARFTVARFRRGFAPVHVGRSAAGKSGRPQMARPPRSPAQIFERYSPRIS